MAIPLIPLAGAALQFIPAIGIYALAGLLLDREFGDRDSLPDVGAQIPPFTPPFLGGQCEGVRYRLNWDIQFFSGGEWRNFSLNESAIIYGPISKAFVLENRFSSTYGRELQQVIIAGRDAANNAIELAIDFPILEIGTQYRLISKTITPLDGAVDNCGNLPNPNAPIPPSDGGGSLSPLLDSPIFVNPSAIIPSYNPLLAALAAAAAAAAAALDALEGIKAIGEALGRLKDLLEEFLDRENEKDKKDRDKRRISVGGWRRMAVDGGFAIGKFTAQEIEYSPYQLQIEIEKFPPTVSRRLGINSPSYAHLEPIGWVFLRSANGGYSEPVPLRFLRNSISLNEDTTGISFSFRENPSARADCRIWYSSDPSIS